MSVGLASVVASEIARLGWNPRIEFAMHGEPSMHPELPAIIAAFRSALPKVSLMLTTNGSGLLNPLKVQQVFDAGLNTLAFDAYKHAQWGERALAAIKAFAEEANVPYWFYPDDPAASPHTRFNKKRIVVIRDITDNTEGTHTLTNQGGNSFAAVTSLQQRCAKPFREFAIRWDGNVAICCDDWRGQYKIGNVNDLRLDDIWNHPRWVAARQFLLQGDRASLTPCKWCNVRTYRNGLLPDKKGQVTMEAPGEVAMFHALQAINGLPFSIKEVK
jgi:radical SAM protein with 4Fe4S-binding SPASM domain